MTIKMGIAVLVVLNSALACELTVQSVKVVRSQSAEVEISLNSGSSRPTAIQFDLGFDADTLKVGAVVGVAAKSAGKSLLSSELGQGRRRFIIAGLNREAISDGVVVRLTIDVSATSKVADYVLSISSARGVDQDARSLSVTVSDGVVKVIAPQEPSR